MTSIDTALGSWIDRAVAAISPRRAFLRRLYRDRLTNGTRDPEVLSFFKRADMYAGAKATRLTGSWSIANSNVNDIIGASSPALRAKVRQLIRDFPYLARAANVIVDYAVGPGILYQAKAKDDNGKPDKKRNQEIEDAVAWWMDEASADGKHHYYDLMRLAKRQDLEAGEFLARQDLSESP